MLSKIVLTLAVIAGVLFLTRRGRLAGPPRRRGVGGPPPVPMIRCPRCGAYHAASTRCDCDMHPTPRD